MRLGFGNARHAHIKVDQLSAYIDHQVTAAEKAQIDQHLRTCASCQAELNSLRQTVQILRALPRMPVPRAFTLSEAQVGAARPAARSPWIWGTVRGLGVVAAVLVVGVIAASLLRPQLANQSAQVAYVPTPTAEARQLAAPAAPQAAGTAQQEQAKVPSKAPPTKAATAPGAAPAPAATAAAPAAPAARSAAPTAAPAAKSQATTAESATGSAASPAPSAPPALAAAAAPAGTGTPPAVGILGRGGGGGGVLDAGRTPEPVPPFAPLTVAFPSDAGFAYTDGQALTVMDRAGGSRVLVHARGIMEPAISPDRAWTVYRMMDESALDLWAVRWDGSDRHMLLSDAALPPSPVTKTYTERHLAGGFSWVPGTHRLSFGIISLDTRASVPAPRLELWTVDLDSNTQRFGLEIGLDSAFAYAPGGKHIAILQRGGGQEPMGSLSIVASDGTNLRTVLTFPANAEGFGYESQLAWLPDGSAAQVAIPDADASPAQARGGVTLYRANVSGAVQKLGHIDALDSSWSPDGTRLAFTRPVDSSPENRQLLLANADGSNAQPYVALQRGLFTAWSPDGARFLYMNREQWYIGMKGQEPVRLGDAFSIVEPRWANSRQLLYLSMQPDDWVLAVQPVDGKPSALARLPNGVAWDTTRPAAAPK